MHLCARLHNELGLIGEWVCSEATELGSAVASIDSSAVSSTAMLDFEIDNYASGTESGVDMTYSKATGLQVLCDVGRHVLPSWLSLPAVPTLCAWLSRAKRDAPSSPLLQVSNKTSKVSYETISVDTAGVMTSSRRQLQANGGSVVHPTTTTFILSLENRGDDEGDDSVRCAHWMREPARSMRGAPHKRAACGGEKPRALDEGTSFGAWARGLHWSPEPGWC